MDTDMSMPARGGPAEDDALADELPKGVEGTRGEKDSAWRARQWYLEQRGLATDEAAPAPEEPDTGALQGTQPEGSDEMTQPNQMAPKATIATMEYEGRGGSLGETFDDAAISTLLETPSPMDTNLDMGLTQEALGETNGMSIDVSSVRTASQAGTQTVFLRTTDALTLIMSLVASQQLVNSGRKFDANFQIIDFISNAVKVNQWWRNVGFSWGTHFWISQGNNWGPNPSDYTTPAKWSLNAGLYLYRATVEVQGIGAFSFSPEHPFRVR